MAGSILGARDAPGTSSVVWVNRAARRDGQVNTPGPRPCGLFPLCCSGLGRATLAGNCPVGATLSPSQDGLSTPFCQGIGTDPPVSPAGPPTQGTGRNSGPSADNPAGTFLRTDLPLD